MRPISAIPEIELTRWVYYATLIMAKELAMIERRHDNIMQVMREVRDELGRMVS